MPMPLENLATFLRKHPTAKVGENGHQKVMIFMGTEVVGVWWDVHTRADWSEIAQDQQESVGF